jgi:hypothetical protein
MTKNKNGLVLFESYLTERDSPGRNLPPRSIKASDLDNNFKKTTLIEPTSGDGKGSYKVKITENGTEIEFVSDQKYIVAINGSLFSVGFVTIGTPKAL